MGLSATRVKALRRPGRYSDGSGLHLYITKSGGKSWVQRITVDGRRRDLGLGGYPAVTLAQARQRAQENKHAIADGRDPLADNQAKKRKTHCPTFEEASYIVYDLHLPNLKNGKHRTNWIQVLQKHAFPKIGKKPVDVISRADVLAVLTPIWTRTPETARRVRQRIRMILRWATAHGLVQTNWAGEVIDGALPRQPRGKNHFRSLPYQDVPEALAIVEASTASLSARLCFRFLVLTAVRSVEARGATWGEVDMKARTWTIPADRMKAGVEHRNPLSDAAIQVLELAWMMRDGSGLVFPSTFKDGGMVMSDMTFMQLLRRTDLAARTTVHGFRASFRSWALEETDSPWAVAEAALAHVLGNSVEAAYIRSDLFERRRTLMQDWADYVTGKGQAVSG